MRIGTHRKRGSLNEPGALEELDENSVHERVLAEGLHQQHSLLSQHVQHSGDIQHLVGRNIDEKTLLGKHATQATTLTEICLGDRQPSVYLRVFCDNLRSDLF